MTVLRHPNNQGVTLTQWRKTASGGETSLSGTDDFGAGLVYTAGAEQVFVNGVLIERGVDYTASTGTTVTGLTALVAGDIVTVSSPSAFNVANAIPKATVAAKGDLIVANGAASVTNLGVGADGTTLVANSSAGAGVSWTTPITLANPIINGGMDVWQRGSSISLAASTAYTSGWTADRWQAATGTGQATTVARYATSDSTNLPNIQYCMRFQRNSGQTGTALIGFVQNIETANSIPLAGKTVTLSFYARKGADFSAASNTLGTYLYFGTGTDQNIWSGFTSQSSSVLNSNLTGTWQRYVLTTTVSAANTQLAIGFFYTPTGTAATNDYFEVTGVQIDLGTYTATTAPAFRRSGGTLQGELSACERYYERVAPGVTYGYFGRAQVYSSTGINAFIEFKTTKRVIPTAIDASGSFFMNNGASQANLTGSFTLDAGSTQKVGSVLNTVSSLTAGTQWSLGANNSAGAYIGFSAEL